MRRDKGTLLSHQEVDAILKKELNHWTERDVVAVQGGESFVVPMAILAAYRQQVILAEKGSAAAADASIICLEDAGIAANSLKTALEKGNFLQRWAWGVVKGHSDAQTGSFMAKMLHNLKFIIADTLFLPTAVAKVFGKRLEVILQSQNRGSNKIIEGLRTIQLKSI
jgi:hypothetical protein